MRSKLFEVLQRLGRSFMLPIAILPIAGLFLGLGSSLSNPSTIAALHMESYLGSGTFLGNAILVMSGVGSVIFDNLPLLFALAVAIGMARKAKEVAALSAVIAFFVMHATINGLLVANGAIVDGVVAQHILDGSIASVCGLQSLEMGVFGGIIVGLGVSYLHNRYHRIELPSALSFFEGERFVPIVSAVVFLLIGFIMYYVWPIVQNGIFSLGGVIKESGYFGTFIYGCIERLLVPFGLHHVFYIPFWQTALGGSMEVAGTMYYGGQNIFFAQLADPNTVHFSAEATRYLTGKFIFMIFGLPGAALAMYRCAKFEHKKLVASLMVSATLTCVLTGITEPLEFAFLFAAPILFVVDAIFAGLAFMLAQLLNITIGLTFSGGVIDFFVFGILQGNDKTSWLLAIPLGIVYFIAYYFVFKILIERLQLKTIGRGDEEDLKALQKRQYKKQVSEKEENYVVNEQAQKIVVGLGGRDNFSHLDSCITRLRMSIKKMDKVDEGLLKQAGAAAIMKQGSAMQIIFGPKASNICTNVNEYLANTTTDIIVSAKKTNNHGDLLQLCAIVEGEVCPIEHSCDTMFASKLLGDGIMIKPKNGLVVAPCDGMITMIYPTHHAIGIVCDNGCEILLHFGVDSVNLEGIGFDVFVKVKQRVKQQDLLWNADLQYIEKHATSSQINVVFTKISSHYEIEKKYGEMKRGDHCITVQSKK